MSKAGVKRITINQLTTNSADFFIVGVVIAKRSARKFNDRRDGSMRAVCGFTIRDSPIDFINVTVWGSALFVEDFLTRCHIGHVVDLINPKVQPRKETTSRMYEPAVTSNLELVFNESTSEVVPHDVRDSGKFSVLLRLPTKPPTYFISIADVKASGKPLEGQYVNLLVALQKVNPPRQVNTRFGPSTVQDIEVMDQTSLGFLVTTWEQPVIEQITTWVPRDTRLFMADVKMQWSEFKEQMVGNLTGRSVVTVNPNTPEAAALAAYASTVPIQRSAVVDALAASMANPESITNIMSCDAVLEQALCSSNKDSFTALVYAIVEKYDLDGFVPVIKIKCSICGGLVTSTCPNEQCLAQPAYGLVSASYDIRLTLLDHTHALENCRLTGENAAKLLGHSAEEFMQLSIEHKIRLKWNFLLKKVAARLVVLPAQYNGRPLISVVSMETLSLTEFSLGFPMC